MKIVVLDGYTLNPGDLSWNELAELGELTVYDRTKPQDVLSRIGDAEIVFTNKTPLDKEIINNAPNIKFIGILATGYNVVDINAAAQKNIPVCNIPTYGTTAVAQYVFALLLELCHRIGEHNQSVQRGQWTNSEDFCYWNSPLIELSGKTIGIIGFGRIGQNVAKIALAFDMKVIAYDAIAPKTLYPGVEMKSLKELLAQSDIISLHCPLLSDTENMINKNSISEMKDGVIIINTSRGPLIAEKDLAEALCEGKVYGAALDVISVEPIKADNPLLGIDNCIITPHIAWAPKESRNRLMDIAVENLKNFLEGNITNDVT